MTKQHFLTQLDELLELEEGTLTGEETLASIEEWQSLTVMGFIALADEQLDVTVSAQKVAEAKTVNDLVALLGDKIQG